MKELMEYLKAQKKLHIKYVFKMLFDVYALLKALPNMVEIEVTIIINCSHHLFF